MKHSKVSIHCSCEGSRIVSSKLHAYGLYFDLEAEIAKLEGKKSNVAKFSKIVQNEDTMIRIPNSLGAAANRIQVQKPTPTTDDGLWVKEGSYIDGVKAIARGNKIREVQGLIEEFKRPGNISTNVDDWRKMRGTGIVTDGDEEYKVELHWYEAANVGKVKWKVKRLL